MRDAKEFYRPVNLLSSPALPKQDQPGGAPSVVGTPTCRSLTDLRSLAPSSGMCSPDTSVRGGVFGTAQAHHLSLGRSAAQARGDDMTASQTHVELAGDKTLAGVGQQQEKERRDETENARVRRSIYSEGQQGGDTPILSVETSQQSQSCSDPSWDQLLNSLSWHGKQPAQQPWEEHLAAQASRGAVAAKQLVAADSGSAASHARAVPTHIRRASMSSAVMSPQRLPPKTFVEWHSCGNGSAKRSVSEPRQRLKRPAASGPATAADDSGAAYLGGAAYIGTSQGSSAGQGMRERRHPGVTPLVVGSLIGRDDRAVPGRWHTPDHMRSMSLCGISDSVEHGALAAASSPSDIVSPGSLFGSSPGYVYPTPSLAESHSICVTQEYWWYKSCQDRVNWRHKTKRGDA